MAPPRGPCGYEPLSRPNDIRLLDILPGASGEPPSISLRVANLSDGPGFEALSYVWGDVEKTKDLVCNGQRVQVTANLHDALGQLRLADRVRTLWVDALCINQSDLDEKSLQIRIMHLIYKSCRRCVVWLGLADEDSDTAMDMVQLMAELVGRRVNRPLEELDHHLKERGRDSLQALEIGHPEEVLPPKDSPKWIALFRLLTRPWFTRVWVIQEAFFSPTLLFHCGPRTCRYSALYYAADWVLANGHPVSYALQFAGADADNDWYGPDRFNVMFLRPDAHEQQTQRLSALLNHCAKFRATDVRDKVYALMHLPAFRREYPDIRPDYRLPTEAAYVDVALRILREGRDFSMLTMIDRTTRRINDVPRDGEEVLCLPSWIPPWHCPAANPSVSCYWYQFMSAGGTSEKAKAAQVVRLVAPSAELSSPCSDVALDLVSAATSEPVSPSFKSCSTSESAILPRAASAILGVTGFEFDVVHDVCELEFWGRRVPDEPRIPLFRTRTGPWERYRPRKANNDDYSSSSSESDSPLDGNNCPYATEPDIIAAYAMTLTASCREYRGIYTIRCAESNRPHHAADFVAFLTWARTLRRRNPPSDFYPPGLYSADRPTLIDTDSQEVKDMSRRYSIMAWNYNMSRCLYRTRRGYLGTGPHSVQRGDVVCVFMGAAVPFILRPRGDGDDGYTLVGDAYVHGVMDGELVKDWEEGKGGA
ncbi:Heterokaryon incompatibility protein 6 [Apiospora sp. TS-2023a]